MGPLSIFVITTQSFFQRVVNFFPLIESIFHSYHELLVLVVLRIIFDTSTESYFFIALVIIFRRIVILFFGLQYCGIAIEGNWLECLARVFDFLGAHFEDCVTGADECFQRECQGETLSGKETKGVLTFSKKIWKECLCLAKIILAENKNLWVAIKSKM